MIFFGHTRFSIFEPGSAAWLASNGSQFSGPDDYKAYLYSEERLKLRADVFINYSLPQLSLAAKGHTVKHVVAYSDSLPEKYQALLREAADRFPFVLLERGDSKSKAMLPGTPQWNKLINIHRGDNTCFGTYRLDDDDILPVDFFDQMAPYITAANVGNHVSLGSGIAALYEDGKFKNIRGSYYPMLTAGLMNVCGVDETDTLIQPKSAPHHLSDRTNPVILDSRKIGWMSLKHLTQDSGLRLGAGDRVHQRNKIIAQMNKGPALASSADPSASFPALEGKLEWDKNDNSPVKLDVPGDGLLSAEPMVIKVTGTARDIGLSALLQCSDTAVSRNALVSFKFLTANGQKLDSNEYLDHFKRQGISYSTTADIGFFRYLKTVPGRVRTELVLNLPEGISCESVALYRWKNQDTQIKVVNITLQR